MRKLQPYLLLAVFSLFILVPGIINMPVIDRDEAHFAQATRQMLQTGNYFQVRFQEKTRFQKPPGINWLQAAAVKLVSKADNSSIWPYRLPSLLGALCSVLLLYFFSRCFVSEKVAFVAAAFLASTLLLVVEASMAVIDASLLFSVILMQSALWRIYYSNAENKNWGWAICFWLAMTYGMVLKGVTPLVGGLTVIALCIIDRQRKWLRGLHIFSGLSLFIVLSLLWLAKVNAAEHSNYLLQMFHKDLLPKLQGSHESHGKPPLFHLFSLPLTFWPASIFLWQGGVYAILHRHEKLIKFLLAWIVPTWIFFEIMPTKLPQYVLPTFPALALLCSLAVEDLLKLKRTEGRWSVTMRSLWLICSIGFALTCAILSHLLIKHASITGYALFSAIAGLSCLMFTFMQKRNYTQAYLIVFFLAVVSYPLIFGKLLPQLRPLWITSNLTELIDKKNLSPEKPLLVVGFEEPSLVFKLNTHLVQFVDSPSAATALYRDSTRTAVVNAFILSDWNRAQFTYTILGHTQGFNYSKGQWVELYLVKHLN